MKRSLKYLIKDILIVIFTIIQIVVFFYIWRHYQVQTLFNNKDKVWAIVSSYTILLLLFSKFFGVYNIGHKRLIDIIFGQFLTIALSNTLIYLQLSMIKNWPYFYSIKVLGLITIVNFIIMAFASCLMESIYYLMTPIVDAVLITADDNHLEHDLMNNRLDKRFVIKKVIKTSNLSEAEILLEEKNITDEIRNYEVVIIDDIFPPLLRNNILKFCFENNKKVYSKSKISDILIRSADITNLCYNSMMVWNAKTITTEQAIIKRLFDIVISSIALIILSPLFLLIALIIKLTDGGPVFFKQQRYTKDAKIFTIYKFRSMYVQPKGQVQMTTKNDKRITPIGAILRRSHFDELPQLINILKGDMSLVGPRPEMQELYDTYCEKYPEFRYRLKVKAGLTGYAQVYGKYNTTPQDKLKFDLLYIANFSILLDLKLILLTIRVMFKKDTSEGIDENKKNALK